MLRPVGTLRSATISLCVRRSSGSSEAGAGGEPWRGHAPWSDGGSSAMPVRKVRESSYSTAGARRIVVVGTTGSGKTTLAKSLAALLALPHVELDALHWWPGWREAPQGIFQAAVAEVARQDAWVVDGNYSEARGILWPRADVAVWLDYSLRIVLWRVTCRTLRRVLTQEALWNGNRERFWESALGRDSVILWALRTHSRRRREYSALFALPEHAHLRVVRLASPREARSWLAQLGRGASSAPWCLGNPNGA